MRCERFCKARSFEIGTALRRLMDKSALRSEERESTQQSLRDSMVHLQSYVERLLFLAEAGKAICPH